MYYTHFGLTQPPFKITPNTAFFFGGGNRGAILDALIYAIRQGDGVIKVTGEVGSGKTMLCRMLASRLPENIETIYLANPSVLPEDILHALAFELQLPIQAAATRLEVNHALHDFLLERHQQGKQVILLVEEAQGMPLATLEEIRLLSNLETEHSKLLQIVLFGQPELNDNLNLPNMRQLKERITHNFSLSPLSAQEIGEYLSFRLRAAGYHGPDLFSLPLLNYIARHSHGLTRRVNIIADKMLLAAFSEGTHNVTLRHAKAAVQDSEFSRWGKAPWRKFAFPAAAFVAALGLGIALFALYPHQSRQQANQIALAPPPAPAQPVTHAQHDSAAATDILEARLSATENWLSKQPPDTFSIQLTGSSDPEKLKLYLLSLGQIVNPDQVFVYRTTARGKPSMNILYGSFSDLKSATQALLTLPASLKHDQPLLRSVKGIRAELKLVPSH